MSSLHVATSVDERIGGFVPAPRLVARSLVRIGQPADVAATHEPSGSVNYLERDFPEVAVHLFSPEAPRHEFCYE